jgi:hypothetical protein
LQEQPGAGDYNQVGACGQQQLSSKKTLPLYSFGSATRDQAGKVYLTREHEKGQKGDSSPGPVTAHTVRPLSTCLQRLLLLRSVLWVYLSGALPRAWRHHTAQRACAMQLASRSVRQCCARGGVLSMVSCVQTSGSGKQVLSRKRTNPRAAFGTAERFGKYYYSSAVSPGPAAYAA